MPRLSPPRAGIFLLSGYTLRVMEIPLFPLNTVLFPGGPLPLRIFESRYLDMISSCMKQNAPFGVLLIREGHEAGPAAMHTVGTLATVTDWYQGSDGLLGITAVGTERFELLAAARQHDGLYVGEVALLPAVPSMRLPEAHQGLAHILENVLNELGRLYEDLDRHFDDATWVTYRLIEVLPAALEQKQEVLESADIASGLELIAQLIRT